MESPVGAWTEAAVIMPTYVGMTKAHRGLQPRASRSSGREGTAGEPQRSVITSHAAIQALPARAACTSERDEKAAASPRLRDLRLTAVPFKPQSPGLLIVPGALHARLSILGGGRR